MGKFTVELFAKNWASVVDRATGLYEKEALAIDSINVTPTTEPEISKITIVGTGKEKAEQLVEKMKHMSFVKECELAPTEPTQSYYAM